MFWKRHRTAEQPVSQIRESDIAATPGIHRKLTFLQLTQSDLEQLRKIEGIMEIHLEAITDRHYEMLGRYANLKDIIDRHSSIERLSKTFVQYLRSIPRVNIDQSYVNYRVKIGEIHSRIRLTPEWYTGSYIRLYEYLIPAMIEEFGKRPDELAEVLLAFLKIVTLDSQIVLESYQENNDYKVVESVSRVMEIVTGIDNLKYLHEKVEATVEEAHGVSAAAQQLSASVEEVASHAIAVAENTEETIREANLGQEVIEASLNGFLAMTDAFMETQHKLNRLMAEIDNVSQVVSLIKDVAEQTNLLALNASIEAARAGEHGRGFAVVAGEVRKLAEQTKASAAKITETIEHVQTEAHQVGRMAEEMAEQMSQRVDQAKEAISALDKIVNRIEMIGGATGNIAAIAQQQSATTQDITSRIAEVLEHTDEIRRTAEQTGQAVYDASVEIDELRKQAIEAIPELTDKHMIRVVRTEHLLWKWWLYNYVLGYHRMDEAEWTDHHQCRLGKWYDAMRHVERVSSLPAFRKLEAPHRQIHERAKEICRLIEQGRRQEAEAMLKAIEQHSHQVVDLLDQLVAHL